MARIIIFREHHGNRYFIVKNDKERDQVICQIALERIGDDDGFCYYDNETRGEPSLFRDNADLTEKEYIHLMVVCVNDPTLRKPGKDQAYYIKQVVNFMKKRGNVGSDEEWDEHISEGITFKFG